MANKIKTVTKLENGDLEVTLHSGQTITISKNDELFQVFAVFTIVKQD
jgi:hypothetical protein